VIGETRAMVQAGGALHSACCVECVLDQRLGATRFVHQSRDAPKTVPRHERLYVKGPAARSREPRLKRDSDEGRRADSRLSPGDARRNAAPLPPSSECPIVRQWSSKWTTADKPVRGSTTNHPFDALNACSGLANHPTSGAAPLARLAGCI
jgi:hypothetical protein